MEGKLDEVEDSASVSSDSFIDDSEENEPSTSGHDGLLHMQNQPLIDEEIEELIAEFLELESKAAEAQEALEEESLAKVEIEVREELAETVRDDELEKAVADEMETFIQEWEAILDELETESAHLLEQLDGSGIELPSLYKHIESQAPNGCHTEAWKKRTLWTGTQATNDVSDVIADAEKYLEVHRPVRRRHGKLLEEGAGGFLQKKLFDDSNGHLKENCVVDWGLFNKACSDPSSVGDISFGSQHWASVYFASTPKQAAAMGLKFPGVDEVEEIDDINDDCDDPFIADAIANEKQLDLSEEQKRKFKKVNEDDDANIDRKLQLHLKRRRQKRRRKLVASEQALSDDQVNETSLEDPLIDAASPVSRSCKRPRNIEEHDVDTKKSRTVDTSYGAVHAIENGSPSEICNAYEMDNHFIEDSGSDSAGADSAPSQRLNEIFHCTACGEVVVEVYSHPLLRVIICKDCKCLLEAKMRAEGYDCFECFCVWCGRSNDLIGCKSCELLFCSKCLKRNFGEKCFLEFQVSSWLCCCCSPNLLQGLKSELEKATNSQVSKDCSFSCDSDSDNSDAGIKVEISSKRRRKKRIRRIIDDAELGEETRKKIAIEKERQERLKSLHIQFSARSRVMSSLSCNGILEGASIDVLGDALTGYIVNVVREKGEEAVRAPPSISAKLKVHQIAGIRFLWENIIQSVRKVKSGDKGLGCILAHTMGLGKTLQVIAFLYTAMRSADLGLKTALIVTPVNVLHNWRQEFIKWRPIELKPLRVFMLGDVSRERRIELFAKWKAKGGVFLIGYTSFRNLSFGKNVKDHNVARDICCALQDGPDILVCDEAHMIKNTRADVTQALKLVKSQRRIALTGSPLQNNLMEYYCMVDFVREGFLGSSHEFRNRFQNPIENGQHANSTAEDVKIMNQRSHILYEQLKGFVQRMDMNVVKKDLPPKTVFVIAVKLSPLQRELYKRFLDVHGFTNKASTEKIRKCLFAGYQTLTQICNHPGILQLKKEFKDTSRHEASGENFLADDSSSDDNLDYNVVSGEKVGTKIEIPSRKSDYCFLQQDWWNDLFHGDIYKEVDHSGKVVLLLDILTMCSNVGDKSLVFSQSIPTLDLIEQYLSKISRREKKHKCWRKGEDWYRIDGKTEGSERQRLVERFNEPMNTRVKCVLISTRAGSLGINLHSANRVIIIDGSWNPTHDLQAIYRAWRYGQTKPVYAYRLMAHGTMEEKIYKRQVTKEGLAARVVDRQQVHRTMSKEEILHLFDFGDSENHDSFPEVTEGNRRAIDQNISGRVGNMLKEKWLISHGSCFSDKCMESLLQKHHPGWIDNYHEHETLLQENEEEKLSKEEQDMAWEVYQRTLEWEEVQRGPIDEATLERKQPAGSNAPLDEAAPRRKTTFPNPTPPERENSKITQFGEGWQNRSVQRKCTNLSHMLTLRSQGTKVGCTTVCGECAQEISWEILGGDSRPSR